MWLSCDRSPGSIFINLFVYCHLCIKYQVLQLHCSAVADYDLKLYFYSTQHPPWPWCWVFWWEDFQASIIRRNLWPFKAVLETRLQRARRRCRTIWTKLAIPHIFANISIGCKLNQVFQSHRIDRCVQMNLNDHMAGATPNFLEEISIIEHLTTKESFWRRGKELNFNQSSRDQL